MEVPKLYSNILYIHIWPLNLDVFQHLQIFKVYVLKHVENLFNN